MNHLASTTATTLITSHIGDVGKSMLAILAVLLGVMGGYLVFKFGWKTIANLPGGYGYNPQYGSGMSRFRKTNYNASGGHMKAIEF